MSDAAFFWGSPDWFWPAVATGGVALVVLVWSYARSPGRLGLRLTAAALKAAGLAALVFCLLEPLWSGTRPRPGANVFIVLADESRSLQIRDPGARRTRAEQLAAALAEPSPWQTRLGQDFDVRRYGFAERLRSLDEGEPLKADGLGSALATSLATLGRRFEGRPVAGVLLFTDGNATDLAGAAVEWSKLPPVYPVPLGGDDSPRDVRVEAVAVSQTNFEQNPVTITATVAAEGYDGRPIAVELLDQSGKSLERQTVELDRRTSSRLVRLRFRPESSGVSFYQVRAAAEGEMSQFDEAGRVREATLANNVKLATVDRPRGPYRVLYVCGRPNWEFKFLRRAVEADDEVELVGLIRLARREPKFNYLSRAGERTNPLFRGFENPDREAAEQYDEPVLIRIGTRDETELRAGFPKTAEELYQYDAVVLDDVEAGFFDQAQMLLLERFVARRGGGLMMLGGAESFAQGEFRRTAIESLLPVYLKPGETEPAPARYRLSLTREGWLEPWVRLRETEPDERRRLEAMPAFQTLNRVGRLKPGATILASVTADDGTNYPALAVQPYGEGRTAAVLVGDLWRWSLRRAADAEDDLAKAWRQTVRWLVADVPRRVEVEVRHPRGENPQAVELRVLVRDDKYEPLDNGAVSLVVTDPGGERQTLTAEPAADRAGVFAATYVARQSGAYRVEAAAKGPDGAEIGRREAGWTAEPEAEEFRRLRPDLALLARIAQETGGEVIAADRLEQFVADLPNRKIPITEPWTYPIWHRSWIFLLALACLAGEWGLRRWRGLP